MRGGGRVGPGEGHKADRLLEDQADVACSIGGLKRETEDGWVLDVGPTLYPATNSFIHSVFHLFIYLLLLTSN